MPAGFPPSPVSSPPQPMSDLRATLHRDTVLHISTAPTTTREETFEQEEEGEEAQVEIQVRSRRALGRPPDGAACSLGPPGDPGPDRRADERLGGRAGVGNDRSRGLGQAADPGAGPGRG